MQSFRRAFGRPRAKATPGILKRVEARLKEYKSDTLVMVPILAAANMSTTDLKVSPEMLLRDGKHPRTTRAGYTAGATDWLERELQRADQTALDERLTLVAKGLGVERALAGSGVKLYTGGEP